MKMLYKLTILLIALTVSTNLMADGTEPTGNPRQISTLDHLLWISTNNSSWGDDFEQTADIDATATNTWNPDGSGGHYGFSPIGNTTTNFTGSYNGGNHTITGLYINRPTSTNKIGFFGEATGAVIQNLGIVELEIIGFQPTGGLVGGMHSTSVTNCYSSGSLICGASYGGGGLVGKAITSSTISNSHSTAYISGGTRTDRIGGLVGNLDDASSIDNCYSTGSVSGDDIIGGLVGQSDNNSTISNSYSTGVVSGGDDKIGGLVGYSRPTTISNCYSTGTVSGDDEIGGLVGSNVISSTISNCYSTGTVSGDAKIGGLIGNNNSGTTVTNCYSAGSVSGNSSTGGLIGFNNGTVEDSFWDTETSGQATSAAGTGKTTGEMKDVDTFTNTATVGLTIAWNFTNDWQILSVSEGNSYPFLQDPEQSPPPGGPLTWDGSASSDWNTANNWDGNAVPSSAGNVIIANVGSAPIITTGTGASCNNLTVNASASLTVNSGGSLITNGTITNNGTIDIKREISDGQWHLISSPNNNSTANIFLNEYLQTWDESTATWSYITEPTTPLTSVKGFSLWGVAKTESTYTFTGTPNTDNQSIAVTAGGSGGSYNGANLVGNPYPSSLDWSDLDDTWGAVNYWNGTAYVSWNNGTGSGSQYIPPMQGFFIVPSSSGTFSLTNSNRTHTGASSYYKSSSNMVNGIVLAASNGWYNDELYIRFDEESSENFELQYDAYKFLSSTDGLSQLYSTTGDDMLSIDVRPICNIMQIGFQNNADGNYSIDIVEMDGMSAVSIEDTKTNTMHNFTDGAYNFDYSINDAQTRFNLHLQAAGISELSNNLLNIYANGNTVYVKSEQTIKNGSVKIYDITGRVVAQQKISNSTFVKTPANFNTGMYIVVVKTEAGTSSNKVIIN